MTEIADVTQRHNTVISLKTINWTCVRGQIWDAPDRTEAPCHTDLRGPPGQPQAGSGAWPRPRQWRVWGRSQLGDIWDDNADIGKYTMIMDQSETGHWYLPDDPSPRVLYTAALAERTDHLGLKTTHPLGVVNLTTMSHIMPIFPRHTDR